MGKQKVNKIFTGNRQLVFLLCGHAEYFAARLEEAGFTLVNPVFFNQFIVKCQTPRQTKKMLDAIQHSGICWCGVEWAGEPVIRVSVCSHATTKENVDVSAAAFQKALSEV